MPGNSGKRHRILAWSLTAVLLHALVPLTSLAGLAPHADDHVADAATHPTPCPDACPDGAPCDEGCECLCCPGHARLLLPSSEAPLAAIACVGELVAPLREIHPHDVVSRVFRPPRAV